MGTIDVPADHYWGAQTARALIHFAIGRERMPVALHHAFGIVKRAAAEVNVARGALPHDKAMAIIRAADEVASGVLDAEFPLPVWQTGSGTQTNMNVNEVIANRAIQLLGGTLGTKNPVHPNDDVNMAQSSNDIVPTAMHVATALAFIRDVRPAADALVATIENKANFWMSVVKIGRTHLQDAVPLTVGQEWSGWAAQLRGAITQLDYCMPGLLELAAGGTAVGTGLNAPRGFSRAIAARIAALTGLDFVTAPNKFAALGGLDAMVAASAALRHVALVLYKIANDVRWLASGPRCGIGELRLPENEPGSSIMPGKVNPTQCEAMMMIATQIIGLDTAVAFAGAQGNFELNVMRPLVIHNVLSAAQLLSDGMASFRDYTIAGTKLNKARIAEGLEQSLMLVTALTPAIGYDKAAELAHKAHQQGISLRAAAIQAGLLTDAQFDVVVNPIAMVGEGVAGA
jgi:fumarate hydratase class II